MTGIPFPACANPFIEFMASGPGRTIRIVAGLVMIAAGLLLVPAPFGWFVAAAGLAPITTGVLGKCPVIPTPGGRALGARYCPPRQPRS